MTDLPDFSFIQFFQNDEYKIWAILIICGTLIIIILGLRIINTVEKNARHKRQIDYAKIQPRAIIKGRQGELFGEEFDIDN